MVYFDYLSQAKVWLVITDGGAHGPNGGPWWCIKGQQI